MLACILSRMGPKKVVLPINLSRATRRSSRKMAELWRRVGWGWGNVSVKAAEVRADVAGLADGHYLFPDFLPAPDCFATLTRVLDLFREGREMPQSELLSAVHARFGETFGAVERRRLECP